MAGILSGAAVALTLTACGGDDDAAPRVEVPNTILAELVDRVACVDDVDVVIGPATDGVTPIIELSLDESASAEDRLVIPVGAAGDAIETPSGTDPWVWTDPIRYRQVAETVAGALASETDADPELLDRCIARIDSQMTTLDEELFATLGALDADARVIDLDAPGAVYFATRYEFTPSQLPVAIAAAEIVSVDELGDADSYETLMRDVVDGVVTTLG